MTPEAVAPYLAALKAIVATPSATGQPLNPVMTQRYLEACRARRKVRGDVDDVPF